MIVLYSYPLFALRPASHPILHFDALTQVGGGLILRLALVSDTILFPTRCSETKLE